MTGALVYWPRRAIWKANTRTLRYGLETMVKTRAGRTICLEPIVRSRLELLAMPAVVDFKSSLHLAPERSQVAQGGLSDGFCNARLRRIMPSLTSLTPA